MTDDDKNKQGLMWLLIFVAAVVFLAAAIYIGKSIGSATNPDVEVPVDSAVDPQPGDLAPPDKTAEPTEPDEIISAQRMTVPGMVLGMSSAEVESLLEERFTPETSEGNQSFDMRLTPQTANGYSLIAMADNLMDDSVKAQEITAMFRPGDRDNFVLSEYDVRVQCRRGSNAGNWQKQACP